MNIKDFREFKFTELKANILLAFLCCVLAVFANEQKLSNEWNSILGALFVIIIATYTLAHFWFYYKYKTLFAPLGFQRFRKYCQRFALISMVGYFTFSLESYGSLEIVCYIITTCAITLLWFYFKRNACFTKLGSQRERKYIQWFVFIGIAAYLILSINTYDSILEVFPFNIIFPILVILFYLMFFPLIILPLINIIVLIIEFMEFEEEWKK